MFKSLVGTSTIGTFPLSKHYIIYGGFKSRSIRVPWIVQFVMWWYYKRYLLRTSPFF